jgi:hypothetical protein
MKKYLSRLATVAIFLIVPNIALAGVPSTNIGTDISTNNLTAVGTVTGGTLTDGTASITSGVLSGLTTALTVAQGGTGTATALTPGSVVFAGAGGTYSQDNAKLFWDEADGRLGVGTNALTTSPAGILTIYNVHGTGTPTQQLTNDNGQDVFHVQSKGRAVLNGYDNYSGAGPALTVNQYGSDAGTGLTVEQHGLGAGSDAALKVIQDNPSKPSLDVSGGTVFLNTNSNNGVFMLTGTSNGTADIGNINASVVINSATWDVTGGGDFTGVNSLGLGSGTNATTLTSTATAARAISFPNASGTVLLANGDGSGLTGVLSSSLTDDTTNALNIHEGTNHYININTTNGGEDMTFGNATTNPAYDFLGSGAMAVSGLLNANQGFQTNGGVVNINVGDSHAVNIATGGATGPVNIATNGSTSPVTIGGDTNTVAVNTPNWKVNTTGDFQGINSMTMAGVLDLNHNDISNVHTITGGTIQANTNFSANGAPGISATINVDDNTGTPCTITVSEGIITATTCP